MSSISRQLPKSNIARLRAINTFKTAYDATPAGGITLPPDIITELPIIHTDYNSKYQAVNQAEALLAIAIAAKNKASDGLKLTENHFLQVLRLTIARSVFFNDGNWEQNDEDFYNLDETGGNLPDINTDEDILIWADNVVQGEANRILAKPTAPAMTNPTALQVSALIAPMQTATGAVAVATLDLTVARNELTKQNTEADKYILSVWNFLDANASHLDDSARRNILRQFGVVYISTGTPNVIKAHVKKADGTYVQGAVATITQTGATATSNADGLFEISSTALGDLNLTVTFPGFTAANATVNVPDDATGQTFDLGVIELTV